MEIRETKASGRELVIKFACRRCGTETYMPYKQAMENDTYGYLRNSKLPEGWQETGMWCGVLCKECGEKLAEFMKGNG